MSKDPKEQIVDIIDCWIVTLKTGKKVPFSENFRHGLLSRTGIEMLVHSRLMPFALEVARDMAPLHPEAKRRFLKAWIRYGHWIRDSLQDDTLLFDALWELLPPYQGAEPLTLYRGQLWGRKPDDVTFLGASWTDDFNIARIFAMVGTETLKPPGPERDAQIEAQRALGQPVIIQATITPDRIICAVPEHGKSRLYHGQREFIVDPRRLRPDDLYMITTDELDELERQQEQTTAALERRA